MHTQNPITQIATATHAATIPVLSGGGLLDGETVVKIGAVLLFGAGVLDAVLLLGPFECVALFGSTDVLKTVSFVLLGRVVVGALLCDVVVVEIGTVCEGIVHLSSLYNTVPNPVLG